MTPTRAARFRLVLLVAAGAMLLPVAARAYWRGGVFFGFPAIAVAPPPAYYYPPPAYYYPPPAYAVPAPVYAAPPVASSGPPPLAQACYAGPWVCPVDRGTPAGNACSCAGSGGPVWGQAR
jgi:hypothetical protein